MSNVNKLVVDGVTKLDLTADTITANDLVSGVTAHDKSGTSITGTLDVPENQAVKTYSALSQGSFEITPDTNYDGMEKVNLTVSVPCVTSITAGSGLSGGTITSTGTISLDNTIKSKVDAMGNVANLTYTVISTF